MHRLLVRAEGVERVVRTEMTKDEFERAVNNVNMGYERIICLTDSNGSRVYVNPSNVVYMMFE